MSINRMYYGTKKIYSFLENGNTGGDCNCEQEYQNGYNDGVNSVDCSQKYQEGYDNGYADGQANCGGSDGSNPFEIIGYSSEDVNFLASMNSDYAISKMNEWDSSSESARGYFKENEYEFSDAERLFFAPYLNTSNVTDMCEMFYGCKGLIYVPKYDTSKVTQMRDMFGRSGIKFLPAFDTSNVQDIGSFLSECTYLKSIPQLNFSNVNNIGEFFGYWQTPMNIKDLGGFVGLKIDWNDGNGLNNCEKLTHTAIMNVINCLYDFRANGDNETIKTLKIHPTTMTLLSEENILTATNKGWIISE